MFDDAKLANKEDLSLQADLLLAGTERLEDFESLQIGTELATAQGKQSFRIFAFKDKQHEGCVEDLLATHVGHAGAADAAAESRRSASLSPRGRAAGACTVDLSATHVGCACREQWMQRLRIFAFKVKQHEGYGMTFAFKVKQHEGCVEDLLATHVRHAGAADAAAESRCSASRSQRGRATRGLYGRLFGDARGMCLSGVVDAAAPHLCLQGQAARGLRG